MTRLSPPHLTALLLATAVPLPAAAQPGAIVQPSTPNADRLSEQMRILGRSPNDLSALVEAGRLSAKLGDAEAAMQFLARAERVSAGDPRIAAARGAALVTMERPGEALAMFQTAERAGLAMAGYAAERGLAYDLLGHPGNAQRDYRLALAQGDDDEVTRRLALSMGISGDVAGATALLDPLLLRNDRAAWRVRACVLAMSGDAAGADRIAVSMLPGFGPSLAPFFRRLPQLAAADRAFAVHFGRLAPTPERLADARLAPAVTSLPAAVAAAPVAVASVARPAQTVTATPVRRPTASQRRAEQRRQVEAVQLAETRRIADQKAQELAKARADEAARLTALAQAEAAQAQRDRDARLLAAQQAEKARLDEAMRVEATRVAERQAEERRVAAAALAERDRLAQAAVPPVAPPTQVASAPPPPMTPAASPAATVVAARGDTDEVLARIIRNLDIPAAELGVMPPTSAAPTPSAATLAADAEAARRTAQAREDEATAAEAARAATARKAAETRAATLKKAADAKKLADAKKAEDAARAAEAKKAADLKRADPARHWVQVAGGANVADLPKAWRALIAKAPALKAKQAWTTPLRATNRLLAGPFPTDDAAQDFVNTLRRDGLSSFAFTSVAGQKVARVPVK